VAEMSPWAVSEAQHHDNFSLKWRSCATWLSRCTCFCSCLTVCHGTLTVASSDINNHIIEANHIMILNQDRQWCRAIVRRRTFASHMSILNGPITRSCVYAALKKKTVRLAYGVYLRTTPKTPLKTNNNYVTNLCKRPNSIAKKNTSINCQIIRNGRHPVEAPEICYLAACHLLGMGLLTNLISFG
jgi:hypothetical protein